ncbi:hypothetical protein [Mesorhizobium sp. ES1-3]|uniref:hypothetical protein n=1 Tax=Mesorhizobium sp. ES1-3 TaxID=2876628 RepID=UPI001CCB39BC|nr:hypothetical protein [Mesorhizobium sp. ES1-3]MBZ9673796.1 hypothetical protein [Mesorhizobium sp. ES1-3]
MSAQIISFPSVPSSDGSESQRAALIPVRKELVRLVRSAALEPKYRFRAKHDPIYPAQMVDRLFAEAKRAKITHLDIRQALPASPVSWRHIERLRVDHTLEPVEAIKKHRGYITRKVQPYVLVIDTLAKLIGRAADETLYEAFRDTSFLRSASQELDSPSASFSSLLHEMGAYLASTDVFSAYFDRGASCPAFFDQTLGKFVAGPFPAVGKSLEGNFDMWHVGSGLPAVNLIRVKRGEWQGPLLIEKTAIAGPDAKSSKVAEAVNRLNKPRRIEDISSLNAEVCLYTEIGLAIGPLSRPGEFGPLWQTRSRIEIYVDGTKRALTCDSSLTPFAALPESDDEEGRYICDLSDYAATAAILLSDGWHRTTGLGASDWSGNPPLNPFIGLWYDFGLYLKTILGGGDMASERTRPEFCVHWDRVNAESVSQLVELMQEGPEIMFDPMGPHKAEAPREFFFAGKAQALETALSTGALEDTLILSCRELSKALNLYARAREATLQRQTAAMLARWHRNNFQSNDDQ